MVTWKELSDLGIFKGKLNYRVTILRGEVNYFFSIWVRGDQIHLSESNPPFYASKPPATLTSGGFIPQLSYEDEVLQRVLCSLKEELLITAESNEGFGETLSEVPTEETRKNLDEALKRVRFLDLCHGQVRLGPVIDGIQYYLPSDLALVNLEINPALELYNNLLYKTTPGREHDSQT